MDWYPWGEEAFRQAREEDKPVFLSIGYSTCHWCHVMARESFEDQSTAELLNRWFVSVKVDREDWSPTSRKGFLDDYAAGLFAQLALGHIGEKVSGSGGTALPGDPPPHQSSGLLPGWQFCFDAGLCQAPPCSWHPVGQQEVHEYEALRGCPGGCLYCWLILFCQSLQTILRIILDITLAEATLHTQVFQAFLYG